MDFIWGCGLNFNNNSLVLRNKKVDLNFGLKIFIN